VVRHTNSHPEDPGEVPPVIPRLRLHDLEDARLELVQPAALV